MDNTAKFVLDNAESQPEKVKDVLVQLHEKGETVSDVLEFVRELEERKVKIQRGEELRDAKIFDVCGTGGSGKKRINLSTALAVRLSQDGFMIAKHGNKAASGKVGSFDLIETAGFEVADTPEKVRKNLIEKNLAFVFAPMFHPALKHLAPIRQSLCHPTIFNFLGPLLNPIEALTAQMVGVSSVSVLEKLAEVAAELGKNILFVHDSEFGLDDVSIGGETVFAKVQDGEVETGKFVPEDYDVQRILSFDEISGGNVETNFEIFDSLVKGTALEGYQNFLRINQVVAEDFFKKF